MVDFTARLKRVALWCVALQFLAATVAEAPLTPVRLLGVPAALADDDGGEGGGGGGRGGRSNGGRYVDDDNRRPVFRLRAPRWLSPGRVFQKKRAAARRAAPRRAAPRVAAVPLPVHAESQIVVARLTPAVLDQLVAAGYAVVDRRQIALLDGEMLLLRVPEGRTADAALAEVRAASPQSPADLNHYYRPQQEACAGGHCADQVLVAWPSALDTNQACKQDVSIGLVDTAINPDHEAFAARQIDLVRMSDGTALPESNQQHGTAVAALLVGSAQSQTPGLLPGSRLIAVDAFHRGSGSDDRADLFTLVRAVDLLASRDVDAINLSLSGPANAVLERVVTVATERGSILVAAAGNNGARAEPVYPAAYEPVLAVTAIDRGKRVYRRANQGDYVDLAAPGVEVWTAASIRGVRTKTGTSFAAPFVTAAAALMKAGDPTATPGTIAERLTQAAEDLGEPGRDPVFGWGLLNASAVCRR